MRLTGGRLVGHHHCVVSTALLLGLLALAGCRDDVREPVAPVAYDFVARFPAAAVQDAHARGASVVQADIQSDVATDVATGIATDIATRELRLPIGARLDYYLEMPEQATLTFRGPRSDRAGDARLRLLLQADGEVEQVLGELHPSDGLQSLALPGGPGRIIRISFQVVPDREHPSRKGELSLGHPTVRSSVGYPAAKDRTAVAPRPPDARLPRPNIIVYLVDTLRADRLGCYGHVEPLSPNIDAFAADAVVFTRAVAQSSWTKPAVASLFTGVWPGTHGVHTPQHALDERATTLAEILQTAGYRTAGFVTNGHVTEGYGFAQGFDDFVYPAPKGARRRPRSSEELGGRVSRWLERQPREGSFFLYVHTMDPHAPYEAPVAYQRRFAREVLRRDSDFWKALDEVRHGEEEAQHAARDIVPLYDAEVAFNDDSFGTMIATLKAQRLYEDALIVLLADHGEAFWEHGVWGHWKDLHREIMDVPLIIKFPHRDEWRGRRVRLLAQHVDVLPTILESAGIPVPAHVEGRSLRPTVAGDTHGRRGAVGFAVGVDHDGKQHAAVVDGRWKLLRTTEEGKAPQIELYDRDVDPDEREDQARQRSVLAGYLAAQLRWKEQQPGVQWSAPAGDVDPETLENLRALGYVD